MAKKLSLKKTNIYKILQFVQLLKQQGVKVLRVILFGSYATGCADSDSDIDIAVISKQFGRDNIAEMMWLRKLALKVDSHLEPLPLTPQDLNNSYSTFAQEIKQYGIDVKI
ncbi:nucleotidyltransferase domain-containing protein [bacterium]|nr:nucleotidyltransferase domain-containing protein [bacterium]